jgi:crotonobetainyl-CoA:carnitine CoA-transferase CaiB-like acyl-CoA transferase
MGADVVQVEVRKRLDSWRGSYDAPLPAALVDTPAAEHPWNCNPLYNSVNLNKRCVTLDLQEPAGRAVFLRLLPHADFVAENFSPRVLGNLGLSYEAMRKINPRVILCSLSAYGHDGPWANTPGIGGTIEPTSGMSALLGYEDGEPMNSGQMYPDAVAGLYGAAAILAALHARERTGEGQYIDLSMQEANLTFVGDAALEYVLTGRQRPRMANRHTTFAPHGIYPCAGDDRWIAIACETEDQWRSFRESAGHSGWLTDARFSTNAGRKQHEDALDAAIAAWTRSQEREGIAHRLGAAGVIAAPILDALEIAGDPLLRERGIVVDVEHPEAGRLPQVALPLVFSATAPAAVRPAPLLGQHCFEVFSELLGMDRIEYDALVAAGISGSGPPDHISQGVR